MSIDLKKGEKINLNKQSAGLKNIMVGLGWDPAEKKKRSFFASFISQPNFDCDASVLMLDKNGKLASTADVVYFGRLKNENQSIRHMGDNLTGADNGIDKDDEKIFVDLNNVPRKYESLLFVVNIYSCQSRGQDFGMIDNAFIRVVDDQTKKEIVKYNLSALPGKTTLIVGEVTRNGNEWEFKAIGDGTKHTSLTEICRDYQ